MMTAEQLRESILQLAMQGKLVEQRSEEGTGEEVLSLIEKTIKVDKKLSISEEDIPFEIPASWKWTKVGNITVLYNGRAFKPSDWTKNGLPIVRIQNLNDENAPYNRYDGFCDEIHHLYGGELLFAWSGTPGTSFGAHIWRKGEAVLNQHIFKIEFPEEYLDIDYFALALNAQVLSLIRLAHGSAGLQHVTKGVFQNTLIPLPPLAEQKRIVAKIEELMPFIEQYAVASTKLNTLNTTFPEMMKKSILQEAVQGKLVSQDPNDEPASVLLEKIAEEKKRLIKEGKIKKQKPLPAITEDEIPFDIPESWEWVRVGEVGILQTGTTPSKNHKEYFGDYIPFVSPGDISADNNLTCRKDGLSEKGVEFARIIPAKSILQVCIGGSIGKAAINHIDITCNQQINTITPFLVNENYLFYCMISDVVLEQIKKNSGGTATPIINKTLWGNMILPLAPLDEQRRIVQSIETITSIISELEKKQKL